LNSKIAPIYQESETFILNEIFKSNDNVCIYNYIKLMILLKKEQKLNLKCIQPKRLIKQYADPFSNMVIGMEAINSLFSELIYMMFLRMKIGCDLPYSNWFINQIYSHYNSSMDSNGFKSFMTDLNLNKNKINSSKRTNSIYDKVN